MQMIFTLSPLFALLFGVVSTAQAAEFTVSDAAGLMNAVAAINNAPAESSHTITLRRELLDNSGISIERGNTTFVLNGNT